jgi:hypothetical protein
LAGVCSGLYFERNPAPEPTKWKEIADPAVRLRTALGEVYAYHRATEAMMAHVLADARDDPARLRSVLNTSARGLGQGGLSRADGWQSPSDSGRAVPSGSGP